MNKVERDKITSIITNFKFIHQELNSYEKILENMSCNIVHNSEYEITSIGNKIKSCIQKLEEERIKEKEFYKFLEKKYGPGELNINTLEYKIG